MKHVSKAPMAMVILFVVGMLSAACAPGVAPTPTPTKAPAVPATATAAPKVEATKPAALPSPTAPPQSLSPYKIGVALALSGPMTPVGQPSRDGAVALANEINGAGGINGRKVELVVYDDGTDETKAILAVKKLINDDKVLAIIGPVSTGPALAALPAAEEAGVAIMPVTTASVLTDPIRKWVFRFVPGEDKIIEEMYAYLKSKGVKKLATLNPITATGKAATSVIQPTYAKAGFELVAQETFDQNDKDFMAQLTKIKSAGAEGLIIYDSSATSPLVARQMKQAGLNVPWLLPYGVLGIVGTAADAFDGAVVPVPKAYVAEQLPDTDPQKKMALQFAGGVAKSTGKDANPMATNGWDPLLVITEAIRKTNPDPDKLAEARGKVRDGIEGLKNFPTVVSVLSLSPTEHVGIQPGWSALVELKGGKLNFIKR